MDLDRGVLIKNLADMSSTIPMFATQRLNNNFALQMIASRAAVSEFKCMEKERRNVFVRSLTGYMSKLINESLCESHIRSSHELEDLFTDTLFNLGLACVLGLHNYRKKDWDLDSDTYSVSFLKDRDLDSLTT